MFVGDGDDPSKLVCPRLHPASADHVAPQLPDGGVDCSACLSCYSLYNVTVL